MGGLHDTVPDADEHADGRGFVAEAPDSVAIVSALLRAVRCLADRRRRTGLVRRIMELDWSWHDPAAEYISLYERLTA